MGTETMRSIRSRTTAYCRNTVTNEVLRCYLETSTFSSLMGIEWLNDEAVYAYLLLCADGSSYRVIDPLLAVSAEDIIYEDYPAVAGRYLLPYNPSGNHWVLLVLETHEYRAIIYDALAYRYAYIASNLGETYLMQLKQLWSRITDRPLRYIEVAGDELVHVQKDSHSCGVFTCLYGRRLSLEMPTKTEVANELFLTKTRQDILRSLQDAFVSQKDIVSVEAAPLPRVYSAWVGSSYELFFLTKSHDDDFSGDATFRHGDVCDLLYVARCRNINTGEILPCSLEADTFRRLDENLWLNDEAIYAYLLIHTRGSSYYLIDPIMSISDGLDEFHLASARNYMLPFNARRNHWVLLVLMVDEGCMVIYDASAHNYSYNGRLFNTEYRCRIETIWFRVTTKPLISLQIAREDMVHVQEDNVNCGVFTCLYGERLAHGMPTRSEHASRNFLNRMRQKISDTLRFSFVIQQLPIDYLHMIPLPRIYDRWIGTNYELLLTPERVNERTLSSIRRSTSFSMENPSNSLEPACKTPKLSRTFENIVVLDSPRAFRSFVGCTYDSALVWRYLEHRFANMGGVKVVFLNKTTATHGSDDTCNILIILYFNVTNALAAAIVRRTHKRSGTIIDFTSKFSNKLRNELKSFALSFGFRNVQFHCIPCSLGKIDDNDENVCFSVCYAVERNISSNCDGDIEIGAELLEQTKSRVREVLSREVEPFGKTTSSCNLTEHEGNASKRDLRNVEVDHVRGCSVETVARPTHRKRKEGGKRCSAKIGNYSDYNSLGPMDVKCKFCNALSFRAQRNPSCCGQGTVFVPEDSFNPEKDHALDWFWDLVHKDDRLFNMIRPINNLLACAGVVVNLKESDSKAGQRPLIVQGHINAGLCHLNVDSEKACFAQIFIADDMKVKSSIAETMADWKIKIDCGIIERLIVQLKEINCIVRSYMTMYEIYLKEVEERNARDDEALPTILMNIKNRRDFPRDTTETHPGRLNVPVFEDQIAAIYVCKTGEMPTHEELDEGLRIKSRGGRTIAAHYSYNIDALCYPLYFPRGEQYFVKDKLAKCCKPKSGKVRRTNKKDEEFELSDNSGLSDDDEEKENVKAKTVSRREFALYTLARRGDISNHRILGTGKLCSQFILHLYSRIEADRLAAIGKHFTETRSASASAMFSYLDSKLHEKGVKLGKLIDLPASFVGSRKWYSSLYSNAMAVAQRLGKPDLFITFTGNKDWPEIKDNLPTSRDSWLTDPLLCAIVFHSKLHQLLDDLQEKKIFGEVIALQCSVEYQKRGMPHAHILITLKEKLNTPEKIDSYISAEIPEYPKKTDSMYNEKLRLFALVSKFMIHGPCEGRTDLACRSANKLICDKRFPKPFREFTDITNDGYPLYRRRNRGVEVPVGKLKTTVASNQHVVSYNPYLLLRYECHINVEVCAYLQSFKYIFKYIYKGPDQILFELLQNEDQLNREIRMDEHGERTLDIDMRKIFVQAHFMGPVEAAYRTLAFRLQYSKHSVESLVPHLPGEERVYFKASTLKTSVPVKSKLLAYFDLASKNSSVKDMTWIDVAENFRYDKGVYKAYKVKVNKVARLCPVNPKLSELYALRKLLLYRRGVKSYEDLRTVGSKLYTTFMEAAEAAGYIETSTEWELCLKQACVTEMPSAILRLYAHILLYCKPFNPLALWEMFKKDMRPKKTEVSTEAIDFRNLKRIEKILTANGMSLDKCGLGDLLTNFSHDVNSMSPRRENSPPLDYSSSNNLTLEQELNSLNTCQRVAVETILNSVNSGKGAGKHCFFVYGKAGCGKTFTFNKLIHVLRVQGKSVLAVASTGIAATLLDGGRTAHSAFAIPVKKLNHQSIANVDASSEMAGILRNVDVIVWDEVSMQIRFAIECVERLLRDVAEPCNSSLPFGGVTMVLGGDWCQFLPVVPGGGPREIMGATLKFSPLWNLFEVLVLDQNMRLRPGEEEYARWLRLVGEGRNFLSDGTNISLPEEVCAQNEKDVIDWLFTKDVLEDAKKLEKVALLAVRNCDVNELNNLVLSRLPGEEIHLIGVDTPACEDEGIEGMPCDNEEYLHTLTPSNMPQYEIRLKRGAIIMLLRNIDITAQLCNGTRLEVLSVMCESKLLQCRNLINNRTAFITRFPLDFHDETSGLAFRRLQFPIRLSFCMTINKSQGQTFDKVGLIMRTPSFSHGSTYVGLSRVTSKAGLRVTKNWSRFPTELERTMRNIVYPEII